MSSDGWTPPGASPAERPPEAGYGMPPPPIGTAPYAYPPADPHQNWGLAYPGQFLPNLAVGVARPPRPAIVSTAVCLTVAGAALSGAQTLVNDVYQWSHRGDFGPPPGTNAPDFQSVIETSLKIGIALSVVLWLVAAAGVIVCAAFAWRGRNGARIVLACLTAVFALNNLFGAAASLAFRAAAGEATTSPLASAYSAATWWMVPIQAALGVLAALICVLVLLPSASRYFSAGPGRRFISTSQPVRSEI